MVFSPILAVLFLAPGQQDPLPSAEALLKIVDAAQAEFEDVTFVYEGGMKILHPSPPEPGKSAKEPPSFQGVFAYRVKDDSCHDYKFMTESGDPLPSRLVASLLGGGVTREINQTSGVAGETPERVSPGGLLAWDRPDVPFRFFYRPMFRLKLSFSIPSEARPNPFLHYTCLGWETIDGHRVLKVRLHEARDPQPEPRDYSLDWIDLERGAHPIRHENYANGQLRGRIESGPLAQFPIKGDRKVWLPVGGQEFSYLGKDGISKEPTVEVDYQIVAGTVRLNQGLSDRRFEMGHLPSELNGPLKQARDNYKRAGPEYRSKAAVEQRIDKALEETSRLGLEIEAPSPARTEERQISVFSYAVAGLGLACLVVLLVLWRRR